MLLLITLIASLLSTPEGLRLDKGLLDGLRPGDTGEAFYTLHANGRPVRIPVGMIEVADADSRASRIKPGAIALLPGYSVEFDVPPERLNPPAQPDPPGPEKPNIPDPPDPAARLEQSMAEVPGGQYWFGREAGKARFYNQQPRFKQRLEPFWIDLQLTTAEQGFSFQQAEAGCASRGLRLPTELEWEAVVQGGVIKIDPWASEWTSSWYRAYPGNDRTERDYGEKFRVVRGYDPQGRLDPTERFYMAPTERSPQVGYRCVLDP